MLQLHFQALAFSSPSLLAVGSFFFSLHLVGSLGSLVILLETGRIWSHVAPISPLIPVTGA